MTLHCSDMVAPDAIIQQRCRSVVIAEDDAATRMLLTKILQKKNFCVTAVDNGHAAYDAVTREIPDIVLLDWHMPHMDGSEALKLLKKNVLTHGIPVIMLTTETHIDKKEFALTLGAQDYINKPFDPRDLMARIEGILQWRNVLRDEAEHASLSEKAKLASESERRYFGLAEALSPLIVTADGQGVALFCNSIWTEYTGLLVDVLQSAGWFTAVHPDDVGQARLIWEAGLFKGKPFAFDVRLLRSLDKTYRWHNVRVCAIQDEHMVALEWISSFIDIHDYRVADETLRILDHIPDLIVVSDWYGNAQYINPRWTEYTGLALEQSIGLQWLMSLHPDDTTKITSFIQRPLLDFRARYEFEIRLQNSDLSYRFFLVRMALLENSDDHGDRWLTTWTDIDELKTAQKRLAELYANEQRANFALKRAFVPTPLPHIEGLNIDAAYAPVNKDARIGGDWYDIFALPDGRVFFSIGDVSGHGIEAALVMVRARQSIISLAVHEQDPAEVLNRVSSTLLLQEPKLVTAICGYIHPTSMQIIFAIAGHPALMVAHPGGIAHVLPFHALGMGIFPDTQYTSHSVQARAGTTLILYTDGVVEVDRDIIAGEERLLAYVDQAIELHVPNIAAFLYDAIFRTAQAIDDTTIMAISFL